MMAAFILMRLHQGHLSSWPVALELLERCCHRCPQGCAADPGPHPTILSGPFLLLGKSFPVFLCSYHVAADEGFHLEGY